MRKVVIALITLAVFSLSLALPALAGPLSHKAVFVLDEAKYTVDGVTKTMDAKTFATKNRTYVPVRYLAYACGVSEKNVGYADGQVTLVLDGITVKVWVNKKDLKINNEPVTMDVSVLAQGGRTYLPARWVAEAFGYKVDWVPVQQAVLVYPPQGEAPAIPIKDPVQPVQEYKADGMLKDKYPDCIDTSEASCLKPTIWP